VRRLPSRCRRWNWRRSRRGLRIECGFLARYIEEVALPRLNFFRLRHRSLVRGVVLALGALGASLRLAGFPDASALHGSPWQALLAALAFAAMMDTARCMGRKLNFYFAGVLILLYAELMILALVLFFWLYL